jgi:amidase
MEYRTAQALIAALRAREMSAVELLDQTISDIEAGDGDVNAVVVRDFDRARDQARAADQALARGENRPLLGLPMTVKEAFNVAGLPTTWGLPGTEHIPVVEDALVVARLKAAGAVIIGKTNVPVMLADWQTANPVYGVTRNPWDPTRTPGGSSGGAAAALAAGFVALEYGSDLSSSLRAPAHFCGVFAHKPSYGLVPTRGFAPPGVPILPTTSPLDLAVVGPMARSATDLALALDATAGPDSRDAVAYRLSLPPPRHAALKDYRVLLLDQHPLLPTAASIRGTLDALANRLEATDCKVGRSTLQLPDLTAIASTFVELLMAIFSADMPADAFAQARTAADTVPSSATDPRSAAARGAAGAHRDWLLADRRRAGFAGQWRTLFQSWDVVLCPVMPTTAFPLGATTLQVDGVSIPYETQPLWGSLATLAGNPATAMPIGRDEMGLPIGMQIIGPFLEDRTPLVFAALVEREFGGFVAP